jgi:tetratricopeptide (TPR) repeat protein
VRRDGQRIRVTAQLIQTSDQTHVWADSYDRDVSDILKLQSGVARAIANQIRLRLTPQTERRLASAPRSNAQAHEAYLQGQQAWNLRSREGSRRGIEEFQRAVEIDPNYAAAYAGLARAYALSPVYRFLRELEAMPKAREAAARAIALDDSLAEAHTMMGFVKAHYEYDWVAAEREFQRALQLNPSDPYAHLFYSNSCLSPLGRHDEAIAEMKKAIELDPFSPRIQSFLGRTYIWARRYDDALAHLQKTTQMFQASRSITNVWRTCTPIGKSLIRPSPKRHKQGFWLAKILEASYSWKTRCTRRLRRADRGATGQSCWSFPNEATIPQKLIRPTTAWRSCMLDSERRKRRCRRWSRHTECASST